jgi:hypothetical protein
LGSDILAISDVLASPKHILGEAWVDKLQRIEPDGWYPIGWLLEMTEIIAVKVGSSGLRQLGRKLFLQTHAERLKTSAKSARDVVYGIDAMYHHANRGDGIGGWTVLKFTPGVAELEKTTPHHCGMEEGILLEAFKLVDAPALVTQRQCCREGADSCIFVFSSAVNHLQWMGEG